MNGFFPCLLLSNVLSPPLSASPGGTPGSAIVPIARQQITITASVRPTLALRHQTMSSGGSRAICIKSNIPMMNYDVKVEVNRDMAILLPHSLKDQMNFACSTHNEVANLLKKLEISDDNAQKPSAVTLIIAPH
jgi:hypothetical protein